MGAMSRVKRNHDMWHKLTVRDDGNRADCILVTGGRMAYLWIGKDNFTEGGCLTFSGAATLRRLAKEILKEVGAR